MIERKIVYAEYEHELIGKSFTLKKYANEHLDSDVKMIVKKYFYEAEIYYLKFVVLEPDFYKNKILNLGIELFLELQKENKIISIE